jgi:secretion/DNA translocation related TadE-like protein
VAALTGRGHDRGSATVWALTVVSVLAAAVAAGLSVGAVVLTRHRAAGAADVAALTAAARVVDGATAACEQARAAAEADGGRLIRCTIEGAVGVVSVEVAPPAWLGWLGAAVARSRAGPTAAFP